MPNIRVTPFQHRELTILAGIVQQAMSKRVPLSTVIVILLELKDKHRASFDELVRKRRVFEEDYVDKLQEMRDKGLPTSRDISI